ncbi:hypothetical protein F5876DRAFT_69984 [Lentinula aff. lateritia]|uniref:Uncharacterized protein n=1 Tax=Lentinula aff. lateritia TaxID=2804960 RepID=A0ACC1TKH8_9AGAR|nr:hypothetical protein F5876DRAFT_69984 [Lentinula aff. lateritia]
MARLLHLPSRHLEAQNKLRQELIEAKRTKNGQDCSYEELTALPYLDADDFPWWWTLLHSLPIRDESCHLHPGAAPIIGKDNHPQLPVNISLCIDSLNLPNQIDIYED